VKYRIRRAAERDIPHMVDLAVDAVVHSVSPFRDIPEETVKVFRRKDLGALQDGIKQPHVGLFVAEDEGGRFIGHVIVVCGYMESSTGETQGWIFDLSVVPDCWSHGVGKALMETAEGFCAGMGFKYLGLGVTTANERAVRFYEKLGYREERKRMIKVLELPEAASAPATGRARSADGPPSLEPG
jgi:ribosomal protein S18 acetylase RimI-like enzyme